MTGPVGDGNLKATIGKKSQVTKSKLQLEKKSQAPMG